MAARDVKNRIVAQRYRVREMVAHGAHMITCVVLIATGLYMAIQFNICTLEAWRIISYQDLRLVHVITSILFLMVNWMLIPHNLLTSGHITQYIFGPKDADRLKKAVGALLNKNPFPRYTIFNASTEHYENKLHPAVKLMVIFEGIAIVIIGFSGIIMLDLKFGIVDFNVPAWNNFMAWFVGDITGSISVFFGMTGIEFIRTIHLWATYWFILELIIHLGFLGVDPRLTQYFKAMFLTGKEVIDKDTEIIEGITKERGRSKPILVFD